MVRYKAHINTVLAALQYINHRRRTAQFLSWTVFKRQAATIPSLISLQTLKKLEWARILNGALQGTDNYYFVPCFST